MAKLERVRRGKSWRSLSIISIVVAILILGTFLVVVIYRAVNQTDSSEGSPDSTTEVIMPKYEYPDGATDPEHLAQVLGSQEYYNQLASSKLVWEEVGLKESGLSPGLSILNDPGNPIYGIPPTPWVVAIMHGYVTDVSPSERIVTISRGGEQFSFRIREEGQISVEEFDFGSFRTNIDITEVRKGDYIRIVHIFINSGNLDLPESRGMAIDRWRGDDDPVHIAQVLGSQEAYEELVNSKLLWSQLTVMVLVENPGEPNEYQIDYVVAVMYGDIVDISLSERVVTISREGEQISFRVMDQAQIFLTGGEDKNIDISEIRKGDSVSYVEIFIDPASPNLPQARRQFVIVRYNP